MWSKFRFRIIKTVVELRTIENTSWQADRVQNRHQMLSRILEYCTIIKSIGEGGQRDVYLGDHKEYGPVAIKHAKGLSQEHAEYLRREADVLQKVDTPHIPKLFEYHLDRDAGESIILEQYVAGVELSDCMNRFYNEELCVGLIKQLVEGLSPIWDLRVVHRDIKPQNIIVGDDGLIRIIDFGIARHLDLESVTPDGHIGPNTFLYASPEQLAGKKALIDQRSDFYSIGVTALTLFLQRHPFPITTIPEMLQDRLECNFKKPHDSSSAFSLLVHKLLAPQTFQRFRDHRVLSKYLDNHFLE